MIEPGGDWTPAEDAHLVPFIDGIADIQRIRQVLPGRSYKAIEGRLRRLRHPDRYQQHPSRDRRRAEAVQARAQRREATEALLNHALAFIRRHNLAETQFGVMALRSPGFIASLRSGRLCRPETEAKVRAFMAAGNPKPRSRFSAAAYAYSRVKARNMELEAAAAAHRANDPAEQAKAVIRHAGWCCYEAEITRPAEIGKFFIGSRLVTKAELFEFARRKGWKG